MKKGVLITFVSILLLAGMLVIGDVKPATAAPPQTIELRFAHFLPPVSVRHKAEFVPWAKMIEERTGGKVKITIYPAGSLLKQHEIYDGVINNIAQIGFADIEQAWGRFPRTEVITLPMAPWDESIRTANHTIYRLFERGYLADDYKEVKMLGLIVASPQVLSSTKKPIRTLEDLKGMKIAVGQKGISAALEKMGATCANVLAKDHYMALQKGTVDANVFSWFGMAIFRLLEVTKYHMDSGLGVGPLGVVMNQQTWDSLPADVKSVIDGVSGEWYSKFDADLQKGINEGMVKKAQDMPGHEVIHLSAEERARWVAVCKEIWDEYASDVEAKGVPGKKILGAALEITGEFTNWSLK